MTRDDFRRVALSLPEVVESAHMSHPDFRVGGKIFATLDWPGEGWAMVQLTPEEQHAVCNAKPEIFVPVKGGWGRRGSTNVRLAAADEASVRAAMLDAWRRRAPERLPTPR